MPETSSTSCGCRSSPANACFSAIRMPKSPQPGHHVDFWPPLKIFRSDTGHLPHHRHHHLVWRERPSIVLVDLLVRLAAGQAAQHMGKLTGEVLLHHDHPTNLGD